jgi:hypothetical protein
MMFSLKAELSSRRGFVQKVRRASPVRDEMFIARGLKIISSSVRSDIYYISLLTELR